MAKLPASNGAEGVKKKRRNPGIIGSSISAGFRDYVSGKKKEREEKEIGPAGKIWRNLEKKKKRKHAYGMVLLCASPKKKKKRKRKKKSPQTSFKHLPTCARVGGQKKKGEGRLGFSTAKYTLGGGILSPKLLQQAKEKGGEEKGHGYRLHIKCRMEEKGEEINSYFQKIL